MVKVKGRIHSRYMQIMKKCYCEKWNILKSIEESFLSIASHGMGKGSMHITEMIFEPKYFVGGTMNGSFKGETCGDIENEDGEEVSTKCGPVVHVCQKQKYH